MSLTAAKSMVEFLRQDAGPYLRSAFHYDAEEYELLYIRDDVDEQYTDEELQRVVDDWRAKKWDGDEYERLLSVGNLHCTVRLFDEAIIFHFAQGPRVGTVVTLDPQAGRDLVEFVTECLRQLHLGSPQTIENAPGWVQK